MFRPVGSYVITLLVILAAQCSASNAFAQKTITIATGNYYPWTSKQENHGGFVNHVITESFRKQGINVVYEYMPWARSYFEASKGRYHAASFWACSKERQQHFYCSAPLVTEETMLFYRVSNPIKHWDTIDDLSSFRIGATRGYSYTAEFWQAAKQKKITVDIVTRDRQKFRMLLTNRLDVVLMGKVAGLRLLREQLDQSESKKITYHPKPFVTQTLHLIFPKVNNDSKIMLHMFNEGLSLLRQEGEYGVLTGALQSGNYRSRLAR